MIKLNKTVQPGFSFIEMMIAITLMALFISFAGPQLMKALGKGKTTATVNTLNVVRDAIRNYQMDTGRYPNTLDDLIKKPEGVSGWQSPYVGDETAENPEIPQDAWNQDLVYKLNERGAKPPFELYSLGDPSKDERVYAK